MNSNCLVLYQSLESLRLLADPRPILAHIYLGEPDKAELIEALHLRFITTQQQASSLSEGSFSFCLWGLVWHVHPRSEAKQGAPLFVFEDDPL